MFSCHDKYTGKPGAFRYPPPPRLYNSQLDLPYLLTFWSYLIQILILVIFPHCGSVLQEQASLQERSSNILDSPNHRQSQTSSWTLPLNTFSAAQGSPWAEHGAGCIRLLKFGNALTLVTSSEGVTRSCS